MIEIPIAYVIVATATALSFLRIVGPRNIFIVRASFTVYIVHALLEQCGWIGAKVITRSFPEIERQRYSRRIIPAVPNAPSV